MHGTARVLTASAMLTRREVPGQVELNEQFQRSRMRLSTLGAACATGYVLAAVTQRLIRAFFLGPDASPVQAILVRCQTADRFRATLVLFSIFLSLVVFAAIAMNRVNRSPGAVLLGLLGGVLFVAMEVWYRSIDLFLVSMQWAREYRDATSETVQQQLLARTTEWDRLVEALYFPLLLALLLAVASFALALAGDRRRWVRLAGLGWLEPFNAHAYLPCAIAGYGLTAIWLWREGRATG
jgi:hypothetical protein